MAENDHAAGAQHDIGEGATQIKEGIHEGVAQIKDSAAQLKEQAAQIAEQQKATGARQLSGIAGAVHAAAEQLDDQLPGAARYIHDAAERIDHAAQDLRNRNFADIADGMRRLGQERPLALFGGAVLAGFVLTRFLKSGAAASSDGWRESERT